ncbi:antibiotic biosynthesis monooxygenase family protein [Kozakia baliensis]|uniref:antibiotic biosynthesis monooxygenase family protein n=1 Tax=Kozakia baliensis TaxID=153496 RepID=UPI0013140C96|nr:antibiotic biosynthesis monooxygenase [Kozakia baliensis]
MWAFSVLPSQIKIFESAYGPEGPWARLFSSSPAFLDTRLLRDIDEAGRYLTIDRWSSMAAYEIFRQDHLDAYGALDSACSPLFREKRVVGAFHENPS